MEVRLVDVNGDEAPSVVRCALYNKCLDSEGSFSRVKVASPFSPLKDRERETFALSIGMPDKILSESHRHDFGCRVAVAANEFFEEKFGRAPVRGEESIHYIGSFRIDVGAVLGLASDIFDITLAHHPEPGLDEHGHIELTVKAAEISKTKMRGETTRIAVIVADLLFDPKPFVCNADADMMERLSAVRLA